ncbi:hypothetical protein [Streptomyces sp. NPDC047000]|uniref:effector-associated constant component EACC1 n=1 Tax=Streptomyces sp. NPDC047000 TaxID=3155474 RepID=UPI0034084639
MAHPALTVKLGNAQHTASLHRWLLRDQRLRGHGSVSLVRSAEEGPAGREQLGDPTAVIAIVLSTALALPEFLASVRRWRTREAPAEPQVTVRTGEVVVEVSHGTTPAQLSALVSALRSAEEQPQEPPREPPQEPGPGSEEAR